MEESREQMEKRLALEYEQYVLLCKANGTDPIKYTNWLTSKKVHGN